MQAFAWAKGPSKARAGDSSCAARRCVFFFCVGLSNGVVLDFFLQTGIEVIGERRSICFRLPLPCRGPGYIRRFYIPRPTDQSTCLSFELLRLPPPVGLE
jgi:hypothetical protein